MLKSLAGVTAGVLLIGGGALATTQLVSSPAADPAPAAAAGAPSPTAGVQARSNGDYPARVFTQTRLNVRNTVQYGSVNNARVFVTANGVDTEPRGTVRVIVDGESRTENLRNGVAIVRLPRGLDPARYTARANFIPKSGSQYKRSSDTDTFRVVKANSRARVNARDIDRGDRPRVHVNIWTPTDITPRGEVRVRISNGRTSDAQTVRLNGGEADVRFERTNRRGTWDVTAVYRGSRDVERDSGTTTFRVTR